MTSTLNALLENLEQQIQHVESQLSAQSGNQSLCQLGKTGKAPKDLKYYEGRYAVLRKLHRLLKSEETLDFAAFAQVLARETSHWHHQCQIHQSQNSPSEAWIAYSQGGLDSCLEIQVLLVNPDPDRPNPIISVS